MDKMLKTKYENLIIEIITQNPRYAGNEDLLKFIYEDVLVRLGGILETISDEAIVRSYIERIAKLSIITVAKKRALLTVEPVEQVSQEKPKDTDDYYKVFNYTPHLNDSQKVRVNSEQLTLIEKELVKIDAEYPFKEYIKMYRLRYAEKKSLEEISDELNVSQAQAAERLFDIAALVKRICGNEVSKV